MKLFRIYVFTLLLISIATTQTPAYTDSIGIETGDEVNLHYILSFDGKVQQENPDFTTYVHNNRLIQGFYLGLLGMKIGDQKNIVVPIGKGYPSNHELGDKVLYFDVTIHTITKNVRDENYVEPPTDPSVTNFTTHSSGTFTPSDEVNGTVKTISNLSDGDGIQVSQNPFLIFLGISTLVFFKKRVGGKNDLS